MKLRQYLTITGESQSEFADRCGLSKARVCHACAERHVGIAGAVRIVQATGGAVGFADLLDPRSLAFVEAIVRAAALRPRWPGTVPETAVVAAE